MANWDWLQVLSMWPWAKEHAIRGKKRMDWRVRSKNELPGKGDWWPPARCNFHAHLPQEIKLKKALPQRSGLEHCFHCSFVNIFIQLPEQHQSDSLVHIAEGFFSLNPCQEPAWWPCWCGWWCVTCQPMTAVLPQPRRQCWATLPLSPHPCACTSQFSLCDTGNVCYKTSHFCPLEPWFGKHNMFCPAFGHKESKHLPDCVLLHMSVSGWVHVPVNFWHSSGGSLCSVSWNNTMLSWLILDPRAAQPQSALCCAVLKYRSLHPRHCSSSDSI